MKLQQQAPGSGKEGKSKRQLDSYFSKGIRRTKNAPAVAYKARVQRKREKHLHRLLEEE